MNAERLAWAAVPVTQEYDGARLGDPRRGQRLGRIVRAAADNPGVGFPQMFDTDSQAEGLYRFVNNDHVDSASVLAGHVDASLLRAQQEGIALVVHDTTELDYSGEVPRKGLGRLGGSDSGYLAHVSLLVSADGERVPIGVTALEHFARTGRKKQKQNSKARRGDSTRESTRWLRQLAHVEGLRGNRFEAIHLMDREADIYELVAWAVSNEARFVIRAAQDRSIQDDDCARLFDALASLTPVATRTIDLSERAAGTTPSQLKRHPKRSAHEATIAIAGKRVILRRPQGASADLAKATEVNVVRVWEPNPTPGEPAVEWVLLTSEPIDTEEQLCRIVDWYRARWTIEEFFKALKSGCSIEKRQLESYEALTIALAIFVPIAWRMLLLRSLSRNCPEAPAATVLNDVQLRVLARKLRRDLSTLLTVHQCLYAVAKLGGHLKSNGPPGWQTLGRGYEKLLILEEGFRTAMAEFTATRSDQ
jgi:transposase-like protein/DDE family transposase